MKRNILNKKVKTFWIFEGSNLCYSKYLGEFRTKKPQQAILKALKITDCDYIGGWRNSNQEYVQYQILKNGLEYNAILVFRNKPNFLKLKLEETYKIKWNKLVLFLDKIYYKYIRLRYPKTTKIWLGIKFKLLVYEGRGKLF